MCNMPFPLSKLGGARAEAENVFLQVWKELLPNSGFIFLMSRFKSTRVSGNVVSRLGGRVMKNIMFANLGVPSHGPHVTL